VFLEFLKVPMLCATINGRSGLVLRPPSPFILSPRRGNSYWPILVFPADRPANPAARIFKETVNDSPSTWGEGWVEGGRDTIPQILGGREWVVEKIKTPRDCSRGVLCF
jgi:hypothetical protein